jgi:endonuclease/exonuclease/phosphatase family metal-dependent hydrolase
MSRRLVASLTLSFCLLPLAAQTQDLRLGTWNLEFLGAAGDFRNHLPPRTDADFQKLGAKVRELGVAVLAVQEICGEAPLQKVATAAGPTWRILLGTSGSWDDGVTSQQIGFLYDDARVELLQAEELLQLPQKVDGVPIFHRIPVTACFRDRRTGFDFRAVTVHLKAGQKPADEQKRRLEASHLAEWLQSVLAEPNQDQDLILLGDFNSTYGTEPQRVFERGGGLQYVIPETPVPTIQHFPEPIDQIVLSAGFTEIPRPSFRVHHDLGGLSKEQWRQTYSDHFPVTVAVQADRDTDPDAVFRPAAPERRLPVALRPATNPAQTAGQGRAKVAPNWPPAIGTTVRVFPVATSALMLEGELAAALPQGPGGWVVVRTAAGLTGMPLDQVRCVEVR